MGSDYKGHLRQGAITHVALQTSVALPPGAPAGTSQPIIPTAGCPRLWRPRALGLGQVQGTFNMAGSGAGSLHPSLALEGIRKLLSFSWPARLGRCCFQLGSPRAAQEVGSVPPSCLGIPSCSTTVVCQQLWVLRLLPGYPALAYCTSWGREPLLNAPSSI